MYTRLLEQVQREVSGQLAYTAVSEIIRHHRIQASPGFRDSAVWCREAFAAAGLGARIEQYPFDGRQTYWASRSFEEWQVDSASLELLEPAGAAKTLCSYAELKMSIIQRSAPTPPSGLVTEVVVLDEPEKPESYQEIDVRGKLVLTNADVERVRQHAVVKHGAIGIISHYMMEFAGVRSRWDLPDTHQYTSFWWGDPEELKCFGFVLTPRQGEWLRTVIRKENAAGRKVMVRAHVSSRFYDGAVDNVEAVIQGTGPGEVVVVAHLCHPQHSANDNASGCAAAIEAARVLEKLVDAGKIERPYRTIRFLLVPEFSGTYAYLARNEDLIGGMVAAINLDMVGQNQELCGSSLLVEKPPRALSSYAGDVAELIAGSLANDATNLAGSDRYALFRHSITPFSGGSDHQIFADPTVGVPCPMIIQWPDKFYHTSADTLDKVDPAMLARVSVLTATYAHYLANAGEAEVIWLAGEMAAIFARECAQAGRRAVASGDGALLRAKLQFEAERKVADVQSLTRLLQGPSPAAVDAIEAATRRVMDMAQATLEHCTRSMAAMESAASDVAASTSTEEHDPRVPRRTFRGPVGRRELLTGVPPAESAAWLAQTTTYLQSLGKDLGVAFGAFYSAVFWTDGRRSLSEINHLVRMESGWCDLGLLQRILDLMARQGLVEWVEA